MAVQQQTNQTPATDQERAPFRVTPGLIFNALGWLIVAVIVGVVVIPGILNGNWKPFAESTTWSFLWEGLWVTIQVAVYSVILSMIFGVIFALGRLSSRKFISVPSVIYIELMRALPSYLIIFFVFIGFPQIFSKVPGLDWLGKLDALWYAVIGLTIYTSAVLAEIVRAGILSIEKGQLEAAYSLGLHPVQTLLHIIMPQALRRMAPNIVSQLITLTKDTSLASIIALQDLTRKGQQFYQLYGNVLETMFVIALIYFVVCYLLSVVSNRLEIKKAPSR